MYIRKVGVTLKANQIVPGEFAFGKYSFVNGVDINGTLKVTGCNVVQGDVVVTNNTSLNHLYAYDATVFDVAEFRNDIYINRDVIVEESMRLKGGFFTQVPDINGNMAWCNVQFTLAQDGFSNINYYGAGFTTPGRVGIGAIGTDEINNQLAIFKRTTGRMFELELTSPTPRLIKSAFIGHPSISSNIFASDIYQDASIVFATPDGHDTDYNLFGYANAPQNFYFFPGGYNTVMSSSIVRPDNPPVLNVNTLKRVGVNTYDPALELDVNGSIKFSCNLYYGTDKVGIWREHVVAKAGSGTFIGLEYFNPGVCSNVAVNAVAEEDFGMVVGGGLKSVHGYYTHLNEKIVPWINSETSQYASIGTTPIRMFTLGKAGIGVKVPNDTLELKEQYSSKTTLRLWRPERFGDNDPVSSIEFDGIYSPWIIQHNDLRQTLEFGYGSNTFDNYTNRRAMWMVKRPSGLQQVVIGGNLFSSDSLANPNPEAALVVDGGLSVIGDVSISGRYIINGSTLVNSNINNEFGLQPAVGNEDVYVSGKRVFVNPTEMLAVGYTDDRITAEEGRKAIFRVYQHDPTVSVIARFICRGANGFIEIMNTSGEAVRIGFRTAEKGFSIWNQSGIPYMTFSSNAATNENMFAINAIKPVGATLHVQTAGVGSNMLRLSRYYATTTTGSDAPEIELENRFENDTQMAFYNKWTLRGPDNSYGNKLSLLYNEQDSSIKTELYSFTKDGRLGIGNTQPEFALDVTASGDNGALRIYNPMNNGAPQIILQSGDSQYGYDSMNDYRIVAQSNTFTVDIKNALATQKLLYFDSNNNLGILGESASNFNVQVNGNLNVTKTIYIDGSPLFDTSSSGASEGFTLSGVNIFITPKVNYAGGVYINRAIPCSNLFHINAASNANIAVFDSPIYNESQIHFRGLAQSNTTHYNVYRLQQSNLNFQIEHNPNSGTNAFIDGLHDGYSNVVRWGPSSRIAGDYDVDIWGSATLRSTAPVLTLASSVIGHLNSNLYIVSPSNVGVGTTAAPEAKLDVFANGNVVGLRVRQSSAGRDVMRMVTSGGSQTLTVTDNGMTWADGSVLCTSGNGAVANLFVSAATSNIGVGTSSPSSIYKMDVVGGARFRSLVSFQIPNGVSSNCIVSLRAKGGRDPVGSNTDYMGFGVATDSLRYHVESNISSHVFYADAAELMRITGSGSIGIGSAAPVEKLDVAGNIVTTGDVYPAMNTLQNLGRAFNRWRDVYAANMIDLAGTTMTINNLGHMRIQSENAPTKVIAKSFIMSDIEKGNNMEMIIGTTEPLVFNETNMQGVITNQYIPFLRSATTGGISVGTTSPEGVLHIVGHNALPTMIIDHDSSLNTSNVVEIRDDGAAFASFSKGGNVGIGSTAPSAKLDVVGQMKVIGSSISLRGSVNSNVGGVFIAASGNVGIGTATPLDVLHVHGTQTFNGVSRFKENVFMEKDIDVRGNSYVHGDSTTDSDKRLKTDIQEIRGALDKVRSLTGYTFMKAHTNARSTGLIAQEVQEVIPEAVMTNPETGYLSVAYGNMMGLIIEAIKELDAKIDRIASTCV
jgi:hypothetical protein